MAEKREDRTRIKEVAEKRERKVKVESRIWEGKTRTTG